jgi:hypothetical protein
MSDTLAGIELVSKRFLHLIDGDGDDEGPIEASSTVAS